MAQDMDSPSPPWSGLPPELLGLVFLRLPKRADRAFFTAVCRAWCSAVRQCHLPPPSPVPWLVLPDGSATSFPRGETFQLPDGVCHHTSYGQWLFLSRRDGSCCFLMNPFTKATVQLPSLSSYSYYREPMEVDEDIMVLEDPWTWADSVVVDPGEVSVLSLAVCSTRLVAAILAVRGVASCVALCQPGAAAWSVSAQEQGFLLSRMVFFQRKLYAFEDMGDYEDLIAIDIVDEHDSDEPRVSRIGRVTIDAPYFRSGMRACYVHYLAVSHSKLLMIRRNALFVPPRVQFEVFEADFEQRLWAKVRTLGNNQALFLGQRYSRAVHTSPYDLSRDCVFFLDDCPDWPGKKTPGSCGVYDMKDEKVYSPLPMVSWKREEVPATWIFSQCETDKLQTEGEGSQEIVEPGEDPLSFMCGGTCSANASTLLKG